MEKLIVMATLSYLAVALSGVFAIFTAVSAFVAKINGI